MKLFKEIAREHASYERRREQIVHASRTILRDAKRVIFLCHEEKLDAAGQLLESVSRSLTRLESKFKKPLSAGLKPFDVYAEGSWAQAIEEYLEATFFYSFLTKRRIIEPTGIRPPATIYIGALADFTGEVLRATVSAGAKKDVQLLEHYRRAAAQVVAFLLPLYLSGQSRLKFDQARRNLKRIEEIIYEVKLRTE